MIIHLSPTRRDDSLEVIKSGDTLSLNGELFDFSRMGVGDTLPAFAIASQWFYGDVERTNEGLVLTLFLPLPWNYSPEQAFPEDLVSVPDGPVLLPQPLPAVPNDFQAEDQT